MKTRSDRLRREIAAIQARESFRTRRYPISLRRAVVHYVHEQRSVGRRPHRVALELGVRQQTLAHWLRSATPSIRPVTIATTESLPTITPMLPSGPVLVLASGHRVEGLDVEQLVTLVRALA